MDTEIICEQFDESQEMQRWLQARLASHGMDPGLSTEITEALTKYFKPADRPAGSFGAVGKRWAIRSKDLNAIDASAKGLLAAMGVYSGGPIAVGIAASAVAFVLLLVSVYRNGVVITEDERSVLLGLKIHRGGCDRISLLRWLQETHPQDLWTSGKVRGTLAGLKQIARTNGAVIALVAKDAAGNWHAQDV